MRTAATVVCIAGLLGGGCSAPARQRQQDGRPSSAALAQHMHELPTPAPHQKVAGGAASATAAIYAFARAYINWSAQTVSSQMRALARRSVGQARSAAALAASETAEDYELQRGGIANSGQVEAVAPRNGHAGQYVVVTRELTTATATTAYEGLTPAWHVAVATVVQQSPGVWVVSGWQPES